MTSLSAAIVVAEKMWPSQEELWPRKAGQVEAKINNTEERRVYRCAVLYTIASCVSTDVFPYLQGIGASSKASRKRRMMTNPAWAEIEIASGPVP